VVAVSLLGLIVTTSLQRSTIPDSLQTQVNLDHVNFVTNDHLKDVLARTTATPEQATRRSPSTRSRAYAANTPTDVSRSPEGPAS
jgi:hypothetical protein